MGGRAPAIPLPESLPARAILSPGMASLLRPPNGAPEPEAAAPVPPAPNVTPFSMTRRLVLVSLVLTDALLVGLAAWLAIKVPGRLGWGGRALCLIALLSGAWLSCLALWLGRQNSKPEV